MEGILFDIEMFASPVTVLLGLVLLAIGVGGILLGYMAGEEASGQRNLWAGSRFSDTREAPGLWVEFSELLPDVPLPRLGRFPCDDPARGQDVALAISTGEQRIYANLLLTIGVVMPA